MTQGIPPLREQQEREFREAVAGAVAACAVDTAARDLLAGTVELWRSVYGATPEEAEAALAAALEERGQGERYTFRTAGIRVPVLSMFPNILEADPA